MTTIIRIATDDGLWALCETGDHRDLEGHRVRDLAAHADEHWAILDERQLWHRAAGGEWERVATSDELELTCVLPYEGGALIGTEEAHLLFHGPLRYGRDALQAVAGFDYAVGRDDWYTPWGGPPDVRSMALAPDGTVFANVHVGGILRAGREGIRWLPTIDQDADVHEVLALPDRPGWLVAACADGLAVSDDGGGTWSFHTAGLESSYARAIALAGDTILMSASDGPSGERSALYRRPLDDTPEASDPAQIFERCRAGLPEWFEDNIDTRCVAGSGAMAAFGTEDGRVFVSKDGGTTWEPARDVLAPVRRVLLE
jgi:photosystem II stability/assembly factor-like uncharacterized protein